MYTNLNISSNIANYMLQLPQVRISNACFS